MFRRHVLAAIVLAYVTFVTSDTIFDWLRPLPRPMTSFLGEPIHSETPSPISQFHRRIVQHLEEHRAKLRQRQQMFNVFAAELPIIPGFNDQRDYDYKPQLLHDDNRQADDDRKYEAFLLGKRNNKAASSWVRSEHRTAPCTVWHCLPPSIHQ